MGHAPRRPYAPAIILCLALTFVSTLCLADSKQAPHPAVPQLTLTLNPPSITVGQSATLSWSTSATQFLFIFPYVTDPKLPAGSVAVSPTATTTYLAIALGQGGYVAREITLTVKPRPPAPVPTITLSVSPTTVVAGQTATLSWSSTNATSVTITPAVTASTTSGSGSVSPTVTTTYTATATGPGGKASTTATLTVDKTIPINHIIFMLQENHSFDNYLGRLNAYRAQLGLPQDVDGLPTDAKGNVIASNPSYDGLSTVQAFHLQTMCIENTDPGWDPSHYDFNRQNPTSNVALNNGFVLTASQYARNNGLNDISGIRTMGYYDWNDLPFYYFAATQFATSDRFFSPVSAATNPNRHYAYASTSSGHAYTWSGPSDPHKMIFDLLNSAGITWKVYAADFGDSVLGEFVGGDNNLDHLVTIDQYNTDLANGTLPQVSMIETSGDNEHPGNDIQNGAAYTQSVVNALIASPYWKDSVLFLSYDEGGGTYDHVPPMTAVSPDGIKPIDLQPGDVQGDFTRTGFRLPLIVFSPFTKPHYVSHTPMDYTAVLNFIETRFGLPHLSARDAAQPSMLEFFDWTAPNLNPPASPAQPTNGPCYTDHLP